MTTSASHFENSDVTMDLFETLLVITGAQLTNITPASEHIDEHLSISTNLAP